MALYTATNQDYSKNYIWGQLAPYSGSTAPTHEDTDGIGGHHCVANITARNAINTVKRVEGMTCFVQSESKEYILQSNLTTWVEYNPVLAVSSSVPYTYTSYAGSGEAWEWLEEYKWDDGRMEVLIWWDWLSTSTWSGTALHYKVTPTATFPTAFIRTPSTIDGAHDAGEGLTWGDIQTLSRTQISMAVITYYQSGQANLYNKCVGRWK